MFTYIDPKIRQRLISENKLVQINTQGEVIEQHETPTLEQRVINLLGPIPLPMNLKGHQYCATWYAAVRSSELQKVEELAENLRQNGSENLFTTLASSMAVNSVLLFGDPANHKSPMVRVHSNCLTGDVFGSQRCECGPQLEKAVKKISDHPSGGMLVYMTGHEGRGIGLWAKAATYLLQDKGEDTYQANQSLGLPADSRDFADAAALILYFLGNRPIKLLTNNPKKIADLTSAGVSKIQPESHVAGVSKWNRRYLSAKKGWGHTLKKKDISQE